jgi:hypothetical protein
MITAIQIDFDNDKEVKKITAIPVISETILEKCINFARINNYSVIEENVIESDCMYGMVLFNGKEFNDINYNGILYLLNSESSQNS